MWQVIKEWMSEILAKLALLIVFLLLFAGASTLTRVVLDWLNYDEASKREVSDRVGNYAALIGSLAITGIIFVLYRARKKTSASLPRQETKRS